MMQSAKILTEDTEIKITLSDVKPGGGAKVKLIVFGGDLTIPVYTKVI